MKLGPCEMCGSALRMPNVPRLAVRGCKPTVVILDVPCTKCPATHMVVAKTGSVVGFNPNQPLYVKNAPSS